jgi:phosphoribosylanthranilate isomerase
MIPVYSPYVHAFLLDSGRPNAATPELGGTGRQHDWTISAEFVEASQLPVFLAGGLSPANVGEAIRQVKPFGVDLSSGVRTEGRLDERKLTAFVLSVRKADEVRGSA